MCAPVMMSFASIIFADPFFSEYSPELVKLVLFSSAVHQLCYVKWSTMPFAVGQVQDAGFIFLSSMARFVVADGQSHDDHAATTMAAALWTLGLATALLGVMLIVIGRLRLASLAQYLPVPVVGGYLAYIGFYCGQAGLAMMAGVEVTPSEIGREAVSWQWPGQDVCRRRRGLRDRADVIDRRETKVVAGVEVADHAFGSSCDLCRLLRLPTCARRRSPSAACGMGRRPAPLKVRKEATRDEKRRSAKTMGALYAPHNANEVLRAVSRVTPRLIPSWLAMVCVVAFSSSLDVAAVEMELGSPLNYRCRRLCGNQNFTARSTRRLLDGVAMPVPRRSTEPPPGLTG